MIFKVASAKTRKRKNKGGNRIQGGNKHGCTYTIELITDNVTGTTKFKCPICNTNIVIGNKTNLNKTNPKNEVESHLNSHTYECCLCSLDSHVYCVGNDKIMSYPKFNSMSELVTHFKIMRDERHISIVNKIGNNLNLQPREIKQLCDDVKIEELENNNNKSLSKTKKSKPQRTQKAKSSKTVKTKKEENEKVAVDDININIQENVEKPEEENEEEKEEVAVDGINVNIEEPRQEYIPWTSEQIPLMTYSENDMKTFWRPLFKDEQEFDELKTYIHNHKTTLCETVKRYIKAYETKDINSTKLQELLCILFYFVGIIGMKMTRVEKYRILLKGGKVGQVFVSKENIQGEFKPSDDIDLQIIYVSKDGIDKGTDTERRHIAMKFIELFQWILEGTEYSERISILIPEDPRARNPDIIKISFQSENGFVAISDINFRGIDANMSEYYVKKRITSHEFHKMFRFNSQSLETMIKEKLEYLLIYYTFPYVRQGYYHLSIVNNPEYFKNVIEPIFRKMTNNIYEYYKGIIEEYTNEESRNRNILSYVIGEQNRYREVLRRNKKNTEAQIEKKINERTKSYNDQIEAYLYGNYIHTINELIMREQTQLKYLYENVLPKFKTQIELLLPLTQGKTVEKLLEEMNATPKFNGAINIANFTIHYVR